MSKNQLITKFQLRDAHVAVIGLGYVGLPLAVAFADAGYHVTGIDLDKRKVEAINRGESYIEDVPAATVAALIKAAQPASVSPADSRTIPSPAQPDDQGLHGPASHFCGSLSATRDFSVLARCDAVSICVPTPLNKTGDPDISYIVNATEQIARHLHPGMVVVLESPPTPARPPRRCCPGCWRAGRTSRWARTSSWPSRPSGWTRDAPTRPRATRPR